MTQAPDNRPFKGSRQSARDSDRVPKELVGDATRPEEDNFLDRIGAVANESAMEPQPVEVSEKDKRTPWQRNHAQIFTRLLTLHAGNPVNVQKFLDSPNPHLGNKSPNELMRRGDYRPVELLVRALENRETTTRKSAKPTGRSSEDVVRGFETTPVAEVDEWVAQMGRPNQEPEVLSDILRLAVSRATDVIGNRDEAMRWLGTPVRGLDFATPISLLGTEEGAQRVDDLLGQMEHGIW
jgi:uncharacterized protein (DUF2384 family)